MIDLDAAVHDDGESRGRRDPARLRADDAELEPQAARPHRHCFARMVGAELGPPEDVHDVDGPGRRDSVLERRVAREPLDLAVVGMHGHHVIPDREQVAEDVVRRPVALDGRPDDGDPAARPQELGDLGVLEHVNVEAPVLKVDQRLRNSSI